MDAYVIHPHHLDHLEPVWRALPDRHRGTLWVGHDRAMLDTASKRGLEYALGRAPPSANPILIASGNELVGYEKAVLLEHGVGQTYNGCDHNAWAGGVGRQNVVLFVVPNERVARANVERYPTTPNAVVGSPHVEALRNMRPYPLMEQRIAISTHWEGSLVPEMRGGWAYFEAAYEKLCRDAPGSVVLHGHPRHQDYVRWKAEEWGVEFEPSFAKLTQRAWLLIHDNCVTPDTPVLCADLVWREAGSLKRGDRLIACDEERTRRGRLRNRVEVDREDRRLRTATVLSNQLKPAQIVLVETTHGELRCTPEHPWLTRRTRLYDYPNPRGGVNHDSFETWSWGTTSTLAVGDRVGFFRRPWKEESSYLAGWLAGLFDGEGCVHIAPPGASGNKQLRLSVAQNPGLVLDRTLAILRGRGVKHVDRKVSNKKCHKIEISDRLDALHLLGAIRPYRLLQKVEDKEPWDGWQVSRSIEQAVVTKITPLGIGEVSALSTTTQTFMANGFYAHNSSALYEWGALGRPVVVVSPPWYRRDVEHGLRFWEFADVGVEVSDPADLDDAILFALAELKPQRYRRQEISHYLFGPTLSDGAAKAAAAAIVDVLEGR